MTRAEKDDLLAFYHSLREQHLSHEDAIRDTVVSVLMSPYFCYRIDAPSLTQTRQSVGGQALRSSRSPTTHSPAA